MPAAGAGIIIQRMEVYMKEHIHPLHVVVDQMHLQCTMRTSTSSGAAAGSRRVLALPNMFGGLGMFGRILNQCTSLCACMPLFVGSTKPCAVNCCTLLRDLWMQHMQIPTWPQQCCRVRQHSNSLPTISPPLPAVGRPLHAQ